MRKLSVVKEAIELTENDILRELKFIKRGIDIVQLAIRRGDKKDASEELKKVIGGLKELQFYYT